MAQNQQVQREVSSLEIITNHVKNKQRDEGDKASLRSWQISPELPESGEIMAFDPPPLPIDPWKGEDVTKDEYLECQYRLNRHEGTELLRRAVNEFRDQPSMMESSDFYIYTQVHVQGYMFARAGAACRISFSTERSPTHVDWPKSVRLAPGTLVALSPRSDAYSTKCHLAVVAAKYLVGGLEPDTEAGEDENTPPRIEIFWTNGEDAILDPSVEFVMIEAKGGYFETVRHAMVGLQHAARYESKFDKYFVEGCTKEGTAAYVQQTPGQVARIPGTAQHFDSSQMQAFKRMTSCELAIVQGPPGTGKTFTSVVALESHVRTLQAGRGKDEPFPPVIVAAQTNHALDQLLGRCGAFDAVIARLGGRTEDEAIEGRTLFNLRKSSKLSRGPLKGDKSRMSILDTIQHSLSTCFPSGLISARHFYAQELITKEQLESLDDDDWESAPLFSGDTEEVTAESMIQWLHGYIEQDQTYVYRPPSNQAEAPTVDDAEVDPRLRREDDEKERLHGEFIPTEFGWTGSVPGTISSQSAWCFQARKLLAKYSNLYEIKPQQRGTVYRWLRKQLVDIVAERFPKQLKEYQAACVEVKVSRWEKDVKILQGERIEVLGCTTTGLTKYRGLIAALKPRVLMVEEAAETREVNIASALYPSLDQIVLVGDHQQLVPHVDVRELGQEPYNLHISLFERLVHQNLPYSMLRVQRRMIPAIREVVNVFYPELKDHQTVMDPRVRPPVKGMGGQNLFWFHHVWSEAQNADDFSFSNPQEADMITRFVRYLILNGVHCSQITILTYYKGQVTQLLEKLRRDPVLLNFNPTRAWSVRTVDGFQGEENEIILLSLVRSARAGFVDNENRAVVALSRARCGMYIFGNAMTLLQSNKRSYETWAKVYNVFVERELIDTTLPVTCENHGRLTEIGDIHDWDTIPGGGCQQRCDEKCPQGHACRSTCHAGDHTRMKCRHGCDKILGCGHACSSFCGDPCECPHQCNKPPPVVLPHRGPPPGVQSHSRMILPTGRGGKSSNGNSAQRGGKAGGTRGGRGAKAHCAGHIQHATVSRKDPTFEQADRDLDQAEANKKRVTSMGSVEQEPTSEELMEMGYHSHISQSRQNKRSSLLSLTIPSFENTAISLTEDSLSDKWSPEKISQREEMPRKRVVGEREEQPSPGPMTLKETYRPTFMATDGTRLYGPPSYAKYTIPAPPPQRGPELAGSEVSTEGAERPSRKRLLLDAAAGLNFEEEYCCVESVSQEWQMEREVKVEDLIDFD
ncbi:hypothetical protein FZEAL_7212 [Fusarium zealandicum]|uniref:Helicase n=1 Tax=Fusarium zealandicum TaxID=1053134 RepID=A0A8H4UGA5_9HYPO|nr:hypothetical protein FZEAL_7212 [Fusarium zealandicum]